MNWLLGSSYRNVLQQIKLVTDSVSPRLPEDINFSDDLKDFVQDGVINVMIIS